MKGEFFFEVPRDYICAPVVALFLNTAISDS